MYDCVTLSPYNIKEYSAEELFCKEVRTRSPLIYQYTLYLSRRIAKFTGSVVLII